MLNTKRLKSLRKKLGYTQKDVALKLRVTQQNYQKWESGFTKSPTTETIIELANKLNDNKEADAFSTSSGSILLDNEEEVQVQIIVTRKKENFYGDFDVVEHNTLVR